MHISILGPIEVIVDGVTRTPSAPKLRSVLGLLTLRAGKVVPVESLIEELWGEEPPSSAMTTLQTYVYQLRKLLFSPERLQTQAPGYLLAIDRESVDVWQFEQLYSRGRRELAAGDVAAAAATLRRALQLWRGDALADVRCGPVLGARVAGLNESRLAAIELRVAADLALGEHTSVIGELRELVARHPLHEGFHAKLMTALARSDRRSEALEVYHQVRLRLRSELNTEPSAVLREVQLAVLNGTREMADPASPPATGATIRPGVPVPAQLPPDIADFVGRGRDLETIVDALTGARPQPAPAPVVAIWGPIGTGKSTLAVRAAHLHRTRYAGGQFYADLGAYAGVPADPAEILAGFLQAVGVSTQDIPASLNARSNAFRSWAADKAVLVVLDNAVDAGQIQPLLPAGDACATIITSRVPVPGLPVTTGLDLPPFSQVEAVALLAEIIGVSRVLAEPEAAADVVYSCGYHPLVVRAFGERIRLDRHMGLGGLSQYLASRRVRAEELRAVDADLWRRVDAVYAELDGPTRHVFQLIGRLPEVFSRKQVKALLHDPDMFGLLLRLIEAGLVSQIEPDSDGELRYEVPEPVRLYATTQLEDGTGAGVVHVGVTRAER
jgi:DNA-binding SARP family transcriptional activator